MDQRRFDQLVRTWTTDQTRRSMVRRLGATVGGAFVAAWGRRPAAAQPVCGNNLTTCQRGADAFDCADLQTSPLHCGSCGTECVGDGEPDRVCVAGVCTPCPAGQTACYSSVGYGFCRDLATDPYHCGACDVICASGQCAGGQCVATPCPAGQTDCGGVCVDIATNPDHCGACAQTGGRYCSSRQCVGGVCVTCEERGLASCPGQGAGNFCWDLATSAANCGACGNVCASGVCDGGVCVDAPTATPTPTAIRAESPPDSVGDTSGTEQPEATTPALTAPVAPATANRGCVPAQIQGGLPASAPEASGEPTTLTIFIQNCPHDAFANRGTDLSGCSLALGTRFTVTTTAGEPIGACRADEISSSGAATCTVAGIPWDSCLYITQDIRDLPAGYRPDFSNRHETYTSVPIVAGVPTGPLRAVFYNLAVAGARDGDRATDTATDGLPAAIYAGDCQPGPFRDPVVTIPAITPPDGEAIGWSDALPVSRSRLDGLMLGDLLTAAPHVIAVFDPADYDRLVACGAIGGIREPSGELVIGLYERNRSGQFGIARIMPTDDGRVSVSLDVIGRDDALAGEA